MAWVIEAVRGLRPSERLVLLVLANYADAQKATCWPSLGRLAEQCEVRVETVRRALKRLEEIGLVIRTERYDPAGGQPSNLYTLDFSTTTDRDEGGLAKKERGGGTPDGGSSPASDAGGGGAPDGGSTTLNHQSNHQLNQRAEDVPVPAVLTTPAFLEKWAEWLDYRRKVKKVPVSVKAARMQLRDCAEVGPAAACEAIDTAMRGDWQGLFPNGGKSKRPAAAEMPEMQNYGWGER
jgi:predicted transcriptional regulator